MTAQDILRVQELIDKAQTNLQLLIWDEEDEGFLTPPQQQMKRVWEERLQTLKTNPEHALKIYK